MSSEKKETKSWHVIPCVACNMLCFEDGLTYETLEEWGAIKDGKMVKHLKECVMGPNAYPRISGRSNSFWKRVFGIGD